MPSVNRKLKIFSVNPKSNFMIDQKIKFGIWSSRHKLRRSYYSIQNVRFLIKKILFNCHFFRSTCFLVNQGSTIFLVKSFIGNFYRNLATCFWSHWQGACFLLQGWRPQFSGSVCAYHPAATGLNPSTTVYLNSAVKRTIINKKNASSTRSYQAVSHPSTIRARC